MNAHSTAHFEKLYKKLCSSMLKAKNKRARKGRQMRERKRGREEGEGK